MIVTDVRTLGAVVRQRRQMLGLSQGRLAVAAGVSRPWVSELENGKSSAEIGLVLGVLDVLGIRLNAVAPDSGRSSSEASRTAVYKLTVRRGSTRLDRPSPADPSMKDGKDLRPAITKGGKSIAAARLRAPIGEKPASPKR